MQCALNKFLVCFLYLNSNNIVNLPQLAHVSNVVAGSLGDFSKEVLVFSVQICKVLDEHFLQLFVIGCTIDLIEYLIKNCRKKIVKIFSFKIMPQGA